MILDLLYFFSFFSFLIFGLGYFTKLRWVAFAGANLIILLGLIILIPIQYRGLVYETGGIQYIDSKNTTIYYVYDEYNRTSIVGTLEFPNYAAVTNPFTYSLGLILLLVGIYLMLMTGLGYI